MAARNSGSGFLILLLIGALIILFLIIIKKINDHIQKQATILFENEKHRLVWEYESERRNLLREITDKRIKVEAELSKARERLERENLYREKLFTEKTHGFPWVADAFSTIRTAYLDMIERELIYKNHPALKAAETVKEIKKVLRESEKRAFSAEAIVNFYEALFPWLADLRDAPDDVISISNSGGNEKDDPASLYLTPAEWEKLSTVQKYQLALDRYISRNKSKWEIGRLYERFIGYEYESRGWTVTYFGAIKGLEDMGRDLIAKKDGRTEIIQCKNWSVEKTIHEKHIFQLYGTCVLYELENRPLCDMRPQLIPTHPCKPLGIFCTSTSLSPKARQCADFLKIKVVENKKLEAFPYIKCNTNREGEKIYHLPFDQQYDHVRIAGKTNSFYCYTVAEAEVKGFRRAWRWRGNRESA